MRGLLVLAIIALIIFFFYYRSKQARKAQIDQYKLPKIARKVLDKEVVFYQKLSRKEKREFRERIRDFLARTKITGVGNLKIDDTDRIFVACSAIIPIFYFKEWRYNNISEVLLYKGTFSKDYRTKGTDRNVLGMVGNGALNRQMIISQPALRQGFQTHGNPNNTGIHEFVHLLDKADGATDGIPEYLIDKDHLTPWLQEMHQQMNLIKNNDSDINEYAATNEAEFLAVTATYFFEKPELLQEHHPKLYGLLKEMFHPQAVEQAG